MSNTPKNITDIDNQIQLVEQLRDFYWQSFRWMLDLNKQSAAELAHAKAFAVNEALKILRGTGFEWPPIPEKYKEIKYGKWRTRE
jgi:hypothetical protein